MSACVRASACSCESNGRTLASPPPPLAISQIADSDSVRDGKPDADAVAFADAIDDAVEESDPDAELICNWNAFAVS